MQQKQSIPEKKVKSFMVGDKVFARAYSGQNKWIPATVTDVTGPVSYVVSLADDSIMRRHIDQLRPRTSKDDDVSMDIIEDNDIDNQGPYCTRSPIEPPPRNPTPPPVSPPVATPSALIIRRSSRNRRLVDRYAPVMST
uniref:Tudor domain-containing protein n=1 Tax=Amphimedon queenslandica TaxID=400682 RepID=A0A1X7UQ90_AMPQE